MTHVTNLGLWGLWHGLTGPAIAASWPRETPNGWPCGWDKWGRVAVGALGKNDIVWSDNLDKSNPTCPHCAVLCDMARGAE